MKDMSAKVLVVFRQQKDTGGVQVVQTAGMMPLYGKARPESEISRVKNKQGKPKSKRCSRPEFCLRTSE
jgi:hypothetical protein